jgi:hypothetical protein
MMTQEQAFLKAQSQLSALLDFVRQADQQHERIDQVERGLFAHLLALGHSLLTGFVAAAGDGNVGDTAAAPDGASYRRLEHPHPRTYRSIFGPLSIERFVYGSREGQPIGCVPLDATLALPAGEFSYVLEDWAQRFCLKGAFAEAVTSLHDLLGLTTSVRGLEHQNQVLAQNAADFSASRPLPAAEEEGELLVVTGDGKGVPMRRPPVAQTRSHAPRRGKGEKANKKQMAYVGAIYTIDRFVRNADDVLQEWTRKQRAKDRPEPCHKHVWAEMTYVDEGDTYNGRIDLFAHLADQQQRRDPQNSKPMVCLLDGERALWDMYREFFEGAVGILDIFHVLERLWSAAYCFHAEKSQAAEAFVAERLRMLLEGKVGYVIGGLRQMGTKHQLRGSKAKTLRQAIGYLENNRAHMRYDVYLAAGYPIGSGVAEGACRHLVKDRLEQTGMRWGLAGAQAMLHVRATYLNGDWEEFLEYRIRREQHALYGAHDAEPHLAMAV